MNNEGLLGLVTGVYAAISASFQGIATDLGNAFGNLIGAEHDNLTSRKLVGQFELALQATLLMIHFDIKPLSAKLLRQVKGGCTGSIVDAGNECRRRNFT